MYIYQLTHRETYARAVVIAETARQAQEMRPDGAFWHDGAWRKSAFALPRPTPWRLAPADPLPCWPNNPDIVCADELGRAHPKWARDVIAFEINDEPRVRGDGPVRWWSNDSE